MRKLMLGTLVLLTLTFSLKAQENPDKAVKKAGRALSAYNLDQANNQAKLQEAKELIDIGITGEETAKEAQTWNTRGEVYNALAASDVNMLFLDENHKISDKSLDYLVEATNSFEKALKMAEKKYRMKDAYKGLRETAQYLNTVGTYLLQQNKYKEAAPALQKVYEINEVMVNENEDPVFEQETDLRNHQYVTAFCSALADDKETAIVLFNDLYENEYPEAAVYSNLFNLLIEKGDEEKAAEVMEKGKKLFPGDTELLFAEINYALRNNKLDELVDKLKLAIEKEPSNLSLYTTLGSVYDQLFQRELAANNMEKADKYFEQAKGVFDQVLEKKPDYFDAVYSIGALYYNKAANLTEELVQLESDLSKEGIKQYNEKKDQIYAFFDDALPYFKKAEQLNPNDVNTLIALKEIYARKDKLEVSNEFKKRLQKIQDGEKIETSYFQK